MKNLKLVALIALFIGFSATNLQAQNKKMDKSARKEQVKIAKEKLALTPDQEVKFKELNKKYGEKMKTVNQEARKEKMNKLKEIKTEKNTEMKTILSDNQYKTYLEMQESRKAKMIEKRKEKRKV